MKVDIQKILLALAKKGFCYIDGSMNTRDNDIHLYVSTGFNTRGNAVDICISNEYIGIVLYTEHLTSKSEDLSFKFGYSDAEEKILKVINSDYVHK